MTYCVGFCHTIIAFVRVTSLCLKRRLRPKYWIRARLFIIGRICVFPCQPSVLPHICSNKNKSDRKAHEKDTRTFFSHMLFFKCALTPCDANIINSTCWSYSNSYRYTALAFSCTSVSKWQDQQNIAQTVFVTQFRYAVSDQKIINHR